MTCLVRAHWEEHERNRLSHTGRRQEAIRLSGRGETRGILLVPSNVSRSELGEVGKYGRA